MSRPQNSLSTLPPPQKEPIQAPKLSQNQKLELKKPQKMKIVHLHE